MTGERSRSAHRALILSWTLAALLVASAATSAAVDATPGVLPPNILIMTADNLGYADLPCFHPESRIQAPHLTQMARDGVRLTSFYTPSSTCTVSRACLLTGRIPQRHGLHIQLPGIEGNYGVGLDPEETLIPQVLKPAGYATGCFGKWNIGFAPGSRPTERGFDEFFGHASGNIDYYTHVYNGRHDLFRGTEPAHVEGYSTDLFADAAIDFITRNRRQPWFVYLPFNAPHFPNPRNKGPGEPAVWQAPNAAFAKYGADRQTTDEQVRYRAVVTALDSAIGRVLQTLETLDLTRRTFVFFYSDNGAFMLENRGLEVSSNAPLRDGGVTCWEGGVRVAAIARWPGVVPEGVAVDEPLWSPDLMIACAALAQASLPEDVVLDGRNPLPVLCDNRPSPHRSMLFTFRRHTALRMGDWKIVRTAPDAPWQLFHLADDLAEQNNLAAERPEVLSRLVAEYERWLQSAADAEP